MLICTMRSLRNEDYGFLVFILVNTHICRNKMYGFLNACCFQKIVADNCVQEYNRHCASLENQKQTFEKEKLFHKVCLFIAK